MSGELRAVLDEVARRLRNLRLWVALAACWLVWVLIGLGLDGMVSRGLAPLVGWRLGLLYGTLAAATGLIVAVVVYRSTRDRRAIARRIEGRYPELATGLLVVVEDDGRQHEAGSGFLRQAVMRGVLDHSREHDWDESVPSWSLLVSELAHAATLGGLIVVTLMLALRDQPSSRSALSADAGRLASGLVIEPGDAEIERGSSLLVVARFNDAVPVEANLIVEGGGPAGASRPMARSLEDPTFASRIDRVDEVLTYRVGFAGLMSEEYRVTVFDIPEVLRVDGDLAYPGYTGLSAKTVEDIRHVTAVEGTELTLRFRLNKEVASARLVENEEVIDLSPARVGSRVYTTTFTLADPKRYRVELIDEDGRANKNPTELSINVTRNRPPEVRVARPARDVRVSPIEELSIAAEHTDDFGLMRHGVTLMIGAEEPTELVLGESENAPKEVGADHLIAFEELGVEPDQLASYHFWAEDVGPDGEPRRTFGEMYFAEIRPFEEIYRQGEQPSGGPPQGQGQQGGNAQQAMELADLQKQIINATWGLIRRASVSSTLPDSFQADANVLIDSQQSAIEQANQLAGELRDPGSIAAMEQATGFMNDAADRLAEAVEGPAADADSDALGAAISPEQAAYQALLRLRDREFQVVQGQPGQQGGGGGAGGPSQQQLQELELSNNENRYEQQRSAQQDALSQQNQEQRELRQVLNRLRELARRQDDLNDRLQELQSALEAAEDEQQREEVERQLKRLREQQQQLLRDADELRERMEREENRDRMAEARQQVERSREHLRQASEALEQGRLSQALTEGTRAGRQLDELREDLRQQTSDRFAEGLREMRDQARQLAESQDELTEQLSDSEGESARSLRGESEGDRLREELAGQREQLDRLLDEMKQTVQDAEQTEPLLAEELFDAVRRVDQLSVPEALEAAEQLAGLGINEEATRASRAAAEGLDELSEGIDRAADRVLGSDTAALRLAQNELDELSDQVNVEINRSAGSDQGDPEEAQGRVNPASPEETEQGERPLDPFDAPDMLGPTGEQGDRGVQDGEEQGQRSPRDPQPGEPRPGERQGGQGQPGEGEGEGQPGDRPQDGQEQQAGQPGQDQQPGPGGQEGQGQQGGQQPGEGQGGSQENQAVGPQDGQGGGGNPQGLDRLLEGFEPGGRSGPGGPITGGGFREWSDRMRDVEELLDDPGLRAEAARIRDRVRAAREQFRRLSKEPDWTKMQDLVAEPIRELRDRVAEELRRQESPDDLVPIDRDPVPPRFAEGVRRYFERLGSGE